MCPGFVGDKGDQWRLRKILTPGSLCPFPSPMLLDRPAQGPWLSDRQPIQNDRKLHRKSSYTSSENNMTRIWDISTHNYMGNNLQMYMYNKSKCQEGDPCSSYIKLTKSQYYCYRIHGYFCPVFILFSPFHTGKMFRSIFFKFHVHV